MQSASDRRAWRAAVCIFVFSFVLRLLYLYESSKNPTFELPIVDSGDYYQMARSLVETKSMGESFFYQPFFYPCFLSLVCFFCGSPIVTTKLIQAVLGSFTCVLTFRLGRRIFDLPTGALAGVITSLYGPLIFFEGELLAAGWAAFWSVALISLFISSGARKSPGFCFILGLGGAWSIITRPTFIPFFLSGCLWLAVVFYRDPVGRRLLARRFVFILAGFLLVAFPLALQNRYITGRFGILPAAGGINLYLGNNPDPCRTLTARPGEEFQRIRDLPKKAGRNGFWDEPRFFYRKTVDYLLAWPFSFLTGLAHKLLRFVSAREIPRTVNIYLFRGWSRLLTSLVWKAGNFGFPFGVLFPLALCGLVCRRREISAPLLLFLIFYPLSVVAVHVSARYRLAVIPPLAVVAAAGVMAIVGMVRKNQWRRAALTLGLMAGVAVFSSLPGPFCEEKVDYEAELYCSLAGKLFSAGRVEEAVVSYEKALLIKPDYAHAHNKFGVALLEMGEVDEAISHCNQALRLKPDYSEARINLGAALGRQGRVEESVLQYKSALESDPFSALAHNNLGTALARQGKLEEAIAHYREALRLRPDFADAHNNLGAALGRQGELEKAVFHFDEALRIEPGFARALHNRRLVLEKQKSEVGGQRTEDR